MDSYCFKQKSHTFPNMYIYLFVVMSTLTAATTDWTRQCNNCRCVEFNGKRIANCIGISLNDIPKDLSSEIREVDFSNNPLYRLNPEVMLRANLLDIHKLNFQNCSLESVDHTAFNGLLLLIKIDLSYNNLTMLDKRTFQDNLKLIDLSLSHNKLTRLDEGLFYNLTHLRQIVLNNNEISSIDKNVFVRLPNLRYINLAFNRLQTIHTDFTQNLAKLNSLNLQGNPWICDCKLQDFRNKTTKGHLIITPTECAEPFRLRGKLWTSSEVFDCLPHIVEVQISKQIVATSSNVTLTCKVSDELQPDVDWVTDGRIIDKDPKQKKFITSKRKDEEYTWNNLTITNVNYKDQGEYKCVAKNLEGVDEKNISLVVTSTGSMSGRPLVPNDMIPLIIGPIAGAVILLVISVVVVLIVCCCNRSFCGFNAKRRDSIETSNEIIHLSRQPGMVRAVITVANPVVAPAMQRYCFAISQQRRNGCQ